MLEDIEGQEDAHVVEIAAAMLSICRDGAAEIRVARLDPVLHKSAVSLRQSVATIVHGCGRLDAPELRALAAVVGRAPVGEAVAANAVAEGLEIGAGQHFATYFHGRQLDLRPREPFPVATFPTHRWVKHPTGNPALRTDRYDALPRLRLAPDDMRGVRVSFRFLDGELAPLENAQRFGIAVIGNGDVATEYEWERYSVDDSPLFFFVRPRAPSEQLAAIREVLRLAAVRKVDVLVMPELCLTEALHHEIESHPALREIEYVVIGSFHAPAGRGPGTNQCSFLVRGRPRATHTKFKPVEFVDHVADDLTPAKVRRREHLGAAEPRIHVVASGDWSVAMLICKDAMDGDVQALVRHLGIKLLLVPAMSPEVGDFEDLARSLGRDPQTYTLVANTGLVNAIGGLPCLTDRVKTVTCKGPAVIVLDREGQQVND